jgi:uncharacterized protein (TIRG00374 family)
MNNKKNGKKRTIRAISTLFFFLFILFILLKVAEIKELINIIKRINPFWLILALFLQYLSFLFVAIFMHEMLLDLKTRNGIWFLTKLNIAATFVDVVIPSQGVSSGIFIFKALGKENIGRGKRAVVIFFSFLINYAIYFLLFGISIIYFFLNFKNLEITIGLLLVFLVMLLIFLFISIALSRQELTIKIFDKLPSKIINKFIKNFEKRSKDVLIDFHKERKKYKFDFYRYGLLMFLSYICRIFVLLFAVLALNYHLTFDKILIAFMFSSIISFISYVKLGFFELGLVIALFAIGIDYNLALATTLVFRLVNFWIPFVFGYIFFRKIVK